LELAALQGLTLSVNERLFRLTDPSLQSRMTTAAQSDACAGGLAAAVRVATSPTRASTAATTPSSRRQSPGLSRMASADAALFPSAQAGRLARIASADVAQLSATRRPGQACDEKSRCGQVLNELQGAIGRISLALEHTKVVMAGFEAQLAAASQGAPASGGSPDLSRSSSCRSLGPEHLSKASSRLGQSTVGQQIGISVSRPTMTNLQRRVEDNRLLCRDSRALMSRAVRFASSCEGAAH